MLFPPPADTGTGILFYTFSAAEVKKESPESPFLLGFSSSFFFILFFFASPSLETRNERRCPFAYEGVSERWPPPQSTRCPRPEGTSASPLLRVTTIPYHFPPFSLDHPGQTNCFQGPRRPPFPLRPSTHRPKFQSVPGAAPKKAF